MSEKVLTVDPFATISELVAVTHAVVGLDYCFVLLNNMMKMSRLGWHQLASAPYVSVAGRDCVIMWTGEPQTGASMGASVPEFFFDSELHKIAYPDAVDIEAPEQKSNPAIQPISMSMMVEEEPEPEPVPFRPAEVDPQSLPDSGPPPVRAIPRSPKRK